MTVKTRGIRLKKSLSPDDQGQRKLMQVTLSQTAAARTQEAEDAATGSPPAPARSQPPAIAAKRRAVARMLRVELEATLAFLDQALDELAGSDPLPGSNRLVK